MEKNNCPLILSKLAFDKICFNRKGFKNENEISFNIEVKISYDNDKIYKVTVILNGDKKDEFDLTISLSGFFSFDSSLTLDDDKKEILLSQNAVAILMPYLRSELSLLTAQPEMECIVLPPFNIKELVKK